MPGNQYDKALDEVAKNCKLSGMSTVDACKIMGISVHTFYSWRSKHPSFKEATDISDEITIRRVEDSLYYLATEGSTTIKTTERYDKDGNMIYMDVQTTKNPPLYSAMARWLTSKNNKVWGIQAPKDPIEGELVGEETNVRFLPISSQNES